MTGVQTPKVGTTSLEGEAAKSYLTGRRLRPIRAGSTLDSSQSLLIRPAQIGNEVSISAPSYRRRLTHSSSIIKHRCDHLRISLSLRPYVSIRHHVPARKLASRLTWRTDKFN